jgi:hypothetical protein
VAAFAVAPAVSAAAPTSPVYDSSGRLVETPFAPSAAPRRLTKTRALAIFLRDDKVADWLDRYPQRGRITDVAYQPDAARCTSGTDGACWEVKIWWKLGKRDAGQIADGRVEDRIGRVTEAWTGPQVAWKMARGYKGAFGGEKINEPAIWLGFCAVFLLGLLDFRRLLSWRNLDLLVLLSFSVSLWFFNRGDVFASVPLAYPPMLYLIARCVWIGARPAPRLDTGARVTRARSAWLLLAVTVFLAGFRIGLNLQDSNVIDVGYAGVIGAQRIASGQSPYDHFPVEDDLKPCGPADAAGEIRERIQTNGRCESANPQGDTYGPVAYQAYLPGYLIRGWSGKWDDLPAVHLTSILFDVLALVGLFLVGRRFGGPWLSAALPFAWAAYPFTQYVSSSNTNDAILPVLLIFGFWLVTSPWARGAFVALSGWTKFASLVVAPLWLTYPGPQPSTRRRRMEDVRALPARPSNPESGSHAVPVVAQRLGPARRPKPSFAFVAGFLLATAAAFSILLLEPSPVQAAKDFYTRTLQNQIERESPFSLWDWRQYFARGLPDLQIVQHVLEGLLVVGAIAAAFLPRRKTPLQLAALTGALLLGFELVLTHWFYLYIPWFFPFVAYAVLAPHGRPHPDVPAVH